MYIYIYIYIYVPGTQMGPLVLFGNSAFFWRIQPPQSKGQKGPFSAYLSRHPQFLCYLNPPRWIWTLEKPFDRSLGKRNETNAQVRSKSQPHLDKDSERTLQVEAERHRDEILVGLRFWDVPPISWCELWEDMSWKISMEKPGMLRSLFLDWLVNWGICGS